MPERPTAPEPARNTGAVHRSISHVMVLLQHVADGKASGIYKLETEAFGGPLQISAVSFSMLSTKSSIR